ncbi:MAG TPA: DUF3597 domain-containing protein, partial [Bryobacteraceae bacterium]|nr:DUF3597 domain-containing protein [Bryobacteraceae bacterium]
MFSNLMSKIFGHTTASSAASPASVPPLTASTDSPPTTAGVTASIGSVPTTAAPAASPATKSPQPTVDVNAVLNELAAKSSEKLDWRTSIVDLLKLVGMDSSLAARKELAAELKYPGDQSDSAKMNVWLHKQVLIKLSENGGKVP